MACPKCKGVGKHRIWCPRRPRNVNVNCPRCASGGGGTSCNCRRVCASPRCKRH